MTEAIGGRAAADYLKLRELVNAEGPYNLVFGHGAPEDEYDPEVQEIYDALACGGVTSDRELAHCIAGIFQRQFGDFCAVGDTQHLAVSIWRYWCERHTASDQPAE